MSERIVVVTGVPGSGKSTVVDGALKKLRAQRITYDILNYGDTMLELMREEGIKDRDEMRKLTLDQQKQLQIKTAEKVGKMNNVIVDTHCTVKTPQGYLPGLPEWVLRKLNPTAIVIVEADPQEIYQRRAKDTTRNRDPDSVEKIAEHQMMNRAAAMAYATLTGATVKIVFNHDNALDAAVKEAEPVIR